MDLGRTTNRRQQLLLLPTNQHQVPTITTEYRQFRNVTKRNKNDDTIPVYMVYRNLREMSAFSQWVFFHSFYSFHNLYGNRIICNIVKKNVWKSQKFFILSLSIALFLSLVFFENLLLVHFNYSNFWTRCGGSSDNLLNFD